MNTLVTGGAGFIGSSVVEQLLNSDFEVTVGIIDIDKPGKVAHLVGDIDFVEGNIRNYEDCVRAVKGIDSVIHMAALINVDHSIKSPLEFYETNVRGTMNLLEAIRHEQSVKKMVYMSTCEVYGNKLDGLLKETDLCDPRSPYASSKYAAERYCLSYYYTYKKPEITIVRGFNTFGPRQTFGVRGAVVAIFINNLLKGIPPTIFGDGNQERDYVPVEDMARGIVAASLTPKLGGEIINLASSNSTSVNELASTILRILNSSLKTKHVISRAGEVSRSCGDPSKAKALLGWEVKTDIIEALTKTVEYFKGVNSCE